MLLDFFRPNEKIKNILMLCSVADPAKVFSRILKPNFCELSDNFPIFLCHVWIRDSGLVKIRIRGSVDKYPGSATLVLCY